MLSGPLKVVLHYYWIFCCDDKEWGKHSVSQSCESEVLMQLHFRRVICAPIRVRLVSEYRSVVTCRLDIVTLIDHPLRHHKANPLWSQVSQCRLACTILSCYHYFAM